jgi:parvulin-like peptidyl-prolyl isomerase
VVAVLLALAVVAAAIVWVTRPSPSAKPSLPYPVTESYPILDILVSTRKGSQDPARPPRSAADTRAAAERVVAAARAPGADFAAIALADSDDPVSAADGAFGGFVSSWPYRGRRNVDEIVLAAATLPIGGVSAPIPVPDGFLVVKRISREDGKAIEARVTAKLHGFFVPWHDLDPTAPSTQTKGMAYAAAASAAADLRSGAVEKPEDAMSRLAAVQPTLMVLRAATSPDLRPLAKVALAAEPDRWLDPVETGRGWAVVRRRAYARCAVRHLLVTHERSAEPVPKNTRPIPEAEEIAQKALERLRRDPSSWDRVVAETSDEKASKDLGGFLGELTTVGDPDHTLEPEIEAAVLALKPGEISEITPSRYGLHIYLRVD